MGEIICTKDTIKLAHCIFLPFYILEGTRRRLPRGRRKMEDVRFYRNVLCFVAGFRVL